METQNTPVEMYQKAGEAVGVFRCYGIQPGIQIQPKIMLVLGSGCGDIAKKIDAKAIISYDNIPHMPTSTVEGHAGNLIIGTYQGKDVVAFQGRHHYYEGYSPQEASFMVYIGKRLGVQAAIMTAAGGIAPRPIGQLGEGRYLASVGDILLMKTVYPNFLPSSMRGAISEETGDRFHGTMNMPSIYLGLLAHEVARQRDVKLGDCVYVPRQGPNYETPAEVSLLSHMSGIVRLPVVGGMSTVPELEAANALGIETLALAVVTNQMFDMIDRQQIERDVLSKFGNLFGEDKLAIHTLGEAHEAIGTLLRQPRHEEVTESAGSEEVTGNLEKLIGGIVYALRS